MPDIRPDISQLPPPARPLVALEHALKPISRSAPGPIDEESIEAEALRRWPNLDRDSVSFGVVVNRIRAERSKATAIHPNGRPSAIDPGGRYRSFSAPELLNMKFEKREDLIAGGLLPAGAIATLIGKPKVGKSTFAYNLGLAVSRGDPFLGRDTRACCVFYIAIEETPDRLKAMLDRLGVTAADTSFRLSAGQPPAGGLDWLIRQIDEFKPKLIVIDTLGRLVNVRDFNDYAVILNATGPFIQLAGDTGATVLFIHHANKAQASDDDASLGSQGLFGSVATQLIIKRRATDRVVSSRQRYEQDLEETVIVMDAETGKITSAGTRQEVDRAQAAAKLVAYFEALDNPVDEATICDSIEARKTLVQSVLRELVGAETVARTGGGKRGDPYFYSLPPAIYQEGEKRIARGPDEIELFSASEGL